METAAVGILNVGAGDITVSFDPANPAERIRAARIVKDMLRRGYALLVKTGEQDGKPVYQRAHDFDEERCEYIIADFDPVAAAESDKLESGNGETEKAGAARTSEQTSTPPLGPSDERIYAPRRGRGRPAKRLRADSTHAVSVSRSAGG